MKTIIGHSKVLENLLWAWQALSEMKNVEKKLWRIDYFSNRIPMAENKVVKYTFLKSYKFGNNKHICQQFSLDTIIYYSLNRFNLII